MPDKWTTKLGRKDKGLMNTHQQIDLDLALAPDAQPLAANCP